MRILIHTPVRALPGCALAKYKTYSLSSLDWKGRVAGRVSDHVIPVYKLWIVKKKSANLMVIDRGQQRLARGRKKNTREDSASH